jgi:hypothetical protein
LKKKKIHTRLNPHPLTQGVALGCYVPALRAELRAVNQAAGLLWSCLVYRRTFGSQLAMKGESLYKIATLMGNSPEICRRHSPRRALLPFLSRTGRSKFGVHRGRKRHQTPKHSPDYPPKLPQTRLDPNQFLRVLGINITVVDGISNVIEPILLIGQFKAFVDIVIGFFSEADPQRVSSLADESRVHYSAIAILHITKRDGSRAIAYECVQELLSTPPVGLWHWPYD